jgi:SAM-dependent methyltransferase
MYTKEEQERYELASKLTLDGEFSEEKWYRIQDMVHDDDWQTQCVNETVGLSVETLKKFEHLRWHERLLEQKYPINNGYVLEIGAHVGRFCLYKVLNSDLISFEATDCGRYITEVSIKHIESLGLSNRIHRTLMVAENLRYLDNVFDRVYALETLEHVGNLDKSLNEIYRVLKPGADLIFYVPLGSWADGGFHTIKEDEEFWRSAFKKYFVCDDIFVYERNDLMGRVSKQI